MSTRSFSTNMFMKLQHQRKNNFSHLAWLRRNNGVLAVRWHHILIDRSRCRSIQSSRTMKSFFSVPFYMTFIFNVCSTRKRCISRIWADIGYSFELLLFLTLGSSLLWKYMMEFQRNAITIRNMLPNIEHVFPIQRWEFELCGRHLDEIHRSRYSTYFFFPPPADGIYRVLWKQWLVAICLFLQLRIFCFVWSRRLIAFFPVIESDKSFPFFSFDFISHRIQPTPAVLLINVFFLFFPLFLSLSRTTFLVCYDQLSHLSRFPYDSRQFYVRNLILLQK